jgi:hypothetical protein
VTYVPKVWHDLPDHSTPLLSTDLGAMSAATAANDAAVTELTTGAPGSLVIKAAKLPDQSATYALVDDAALTGQPTLNGEPIVTAVVQPDGSVTLYANGVEL